MKTRTNLVLYALRSWCLLSAVLTHFFIPSAKKILAFFFFFFLMFHQKCFSGTNQNKQNPTSLLLVAPLPKRVQGTQWHSICLRCYWRHSASKCSSTDVLLCCGIWKTRTTGLEERKKASFEWGGKYLIFSLPDLFLEFSGTCLEKPSIHISLLKLMLFLLLTTGYWNNPCRILNLKLRSSSPSVLSLNVFRIRP